MRHDETGKLKTKPRQDTSVETEPRPRHDKPCLETRHVSQDSITGNIKAELSQA